MSIIISLVNEKTKKVFWKVELKDNLLPIINKLGLYDLIIKKDNNIKGRNIVCDLSLALLNLRKEREYFSEMNNTLEYSTLEKLIIEYLNKCNEKPNFMICINEIKIM